MTISFILGRRRNCICHPSNIGHSEVRNTLSLRNIYIVLSCCSVLHRHLHERILLHVTHDIFVLVLKSESFLLSKIAARQDNTIYIFLRESVFLTSECPILLGWVVFTNIIVTLLDRWWMMNLYIHLLGYVNTWKQDRLKWLEINVREPQRCNHVW
jgi:hypothetical protein